LDRVIIYDNKFNLIGDTDTLDLDPRSFSQKLEVIELRELNEGSNSKNDSKKKKKNKKTLNINDFVINYAKSDEFGKPYTFTKETYNQFLLVTIKNVNDGKDNIGYLAITENANEIRAVINERKNFIIRTFFAVVIVILVFSFVLNRYFLKPIKNLVSYTNIIKDKTKKKLDIESIKKRNDELGKLSKSMDEMTNELQKRINTAENFSHRI
jgi:FOG: HAMP domain